MIVDSSALIAILRSESDAPAFAAAMERHRERKISAGNYLETAIVMDSERDPVISRRLDDLLEKSEIEIVAVTEMHARLARQAYRDFGRGSGHPAKLNFGDCFAYALAVSTGESILAKGNEFQKAGLKLAR